MTLKQRANKINKILTTQFTNPECELNYTQAHELLFATILSAQCTDVRVNKVTESLFKKYKSVSDFALADLNELKQDVKPTGFYNNKAKNIKAAAQLILTKFNGVVPNKMAELITLPGVARKTANVLLWHWYKSNQGIAVDTHVIRLTNKFGLSHSQDPVKIEQELMQLFPQAQWGSTSLRFILHGRTCCKARGGNACENCALGEFWK